MMLPAVIARQKITLVSNEDSPFKTLDDKNAILRVGNQVTGDGLPSSSSVVLPGVASSSTVKL